MNDDRRDAMDGDECCPPGSSCSPSTTSRPATSTGWRRIAFFAIVLAALGVLAYSLMTGDEVTATQVSERTTAESSAWLASSDDLRQAIADNEFVFVVMPSAESSDGAVMQAALGAAKRAQSSGKRIGVVELSPTSAVYTTATERFGLEEFPVVLAMGRDGAAKPVQGAISETSLLKTYLECCPPAGCCPAGRSTKGCAPNACGK